MKRTHSTTVAASAAALALLAACGGDPAAATAAAARFTPRGDVTMLIPFGAGGGSDLAGRATAARHDRGGQRRRSTSTSRTARAAPAPSATPTSWARPATTSTLLATETALLALPISGEVEFDYTDFTPIMKLGDDFTLMVVKADSPFETCADVVEAAKSDRVVAGISGITGLDNIVFTLTEQETGVEFDRVPFESGGELTAALLGGQIDIASLNPGEVIGQLEAGEVKALCAFSEERYADYEELADIETAKEQGIDVAFAQFRGVLAPGGLGEEARAFWIETLEAAVETDEYQQYIEDNYLQANTAAGDEFVTYLEGNNDLLKRFWGMTDPRPRGASRSSRPSCTACSPPSALGALVMAVGYGFFLEGSRVGPGLVPGVVGGLILLIAGWELIATLRGHRTPHDRGLAEVVAAAAAGTPQGDASRSAPPGGAPDGDVTVAPDDAPGEVSGTGPGRTTSTSSAGRRRSGAVSW